MAVWGVAQVSSRLRADSSGVSQEGFWPRRHCRKSSSANCFLGFEFPHGDEEESKGSAREPRGLGV